MLLTRRNIFPVLVLATRSLCSTSTSNLDSRLKATMKIDTPDFKALFTPELEQLAEMFRKNGHEISHFFRMAGGAVRDLLMGIKPADVDFASTATPTQVKDMLDNEKIRMLHKKGEEHGTITCRINDQENFEITTLRIDKVCDGRRAEVEYTTDWKLDAYRRDLTINSMFLGLDGTVYDYTGGIDDVKKRRVAFVGSAKQRIQEDYLRILRYFRFYGRIAKGPYEHEKETIDSISEWKSGLERMSGERVWTELKKILVGRYAGPVIETMLSTCGLQPYLALSNSANVQEFKRVVSSNSQSEDSKVDVDPSTSLSALFNDIEEAEFFQKRTKCSNPERQLCEFIVRNREGAFAHMDDIKFFQDLLLDQVFTSGNHAVKESARENCIQLLKYIDSRKCLEEIRNWKVCVFPVSGIELMKAGVKKGPIMQSTLKYLFDLWKKSSYAMSSDDLLKHSGDEIPEEFCLKNTKGRKRQHS